MGSLVLRLDQGVAAAEGARVLELVRFADRIQSVTVEMACEVPVLVGASGSTPPRSYWRAASSTDGSA
jgi:hypothetical protein